MLRNAINSNSCVPELRVVRLFEFQPACGSSRTRDKDKKGTEFTTNNTYIKISSRHAHAPVLAPEQRDAPRRQRHARVDGQLTARNLLAVDVNEEATRAVDLR